LADEVHAEGAPDRPLGSFHAPLAAEFALPAKG
jgi:hypothetical protein